MVTVVVIVEQVICRYRKQLAQLQNIGCVRQRRTQLPTGNCLTGYVQLFGQFLLRKSVLFSEFQNLFR